MQPRIRAPPDRTTGTVVINATTETDMVAPQRFLSRLPQEAPVLRSHIEGLSEPVFKKALVTSEALGVICGTRPGEVVHVGEANLILPDDLPDFGERIAETDPRGRGIAHDADIAVVEVPGLELAGEIDIEDFDGDVLPCREVARPKPLELLVELGLSLGASALLAELTVAELFRAYYR